MQIKLKLKFHYSHTPSLQSFHLDKKSEPNCWIVMIDWLIEILWHTSNFSHNVPNTIVERRLVASMMMEMVLHTNGGD